MKKDTIISGPKASGKNWISKAIEITHENVIRTTAKEVLNKIYNGFPSNITDKYSLMVINESTKEDILHIDGIIHEFDEFDAWTGASESRRKHLNIIYLTQDNISGADPLFSHLHIINCRNACI